MRVHSDEDCSKNAVLIQAHVNANSTMCAGYPHGQIAGCQVYTHIRTPRPFLRKITSASRSGKSSSNMAAQGTLETYRCFLCGKLDTYSVSITRKTKVVLQ